MNSEGEIQQRSQIRQNQLSSDYKNKEDIEKGKIPLVFCEDGSLYRLFSRNLALGVYKAETRGFVGIREKFGREYLFTEYHYDTGEPFGTVLPQRLLEKCPIIPIEENNQELFDWLKQKENEYLIPLEVK